MSLFFAWGLPEPEREFRFAADAGRRWRFDFAWVAARVALECEGGTWAGGRHVRGRGYAKDCEKYSEAAIRGWCVIRATPAQIDSGQALGWVRRALEVRSNPSKGEHYGNQERSGEV